MYGFFGGCGKKQHTIIVFFPFLDRHHAWWSLDPTLDIWSNFVKKEALNVHFFLSPPLLH